MTSLAVRPGRWARILVLAALAVLLVLAPAQAAHAHAQLLSSDPADGAQLDAAPSALTLTFDEPVTPVAGGTQIFTADGTATTLDATARDGVVTAALPALADDARYVVSWRVVSADGHPIAGSIRFAVGDPPAGAEPVVADGAASSFADIAAAVTAAGQYLGLLVFAGVVLFELLVLRGAGRAGDAEEQTQSRGVARAPTRVARIAAVVAAVGAVLAIPVAAIRAAGIDALWERPASVLAAVAAPTVVAAVVTVVAAAALWLPAGPARRAFVTVGAVAALLTPTLTGHTALREPAWLMVGSDVVHLLAGAVWLGGLIALVLALGALSRSGAPAVEAASLVARFSGWALAAVAALGVSGVVMAVLILEDWSALLGSSFGRALLIKLGLVVVVAALAAVVRRRIVPVVARAPSAAAWRRLRVFLVREAAVLVAVVAVTGLLVSASPTPHSPAVESSASFSAAADGVDLEGEVAASDAGETTISFALTDAAGAQVTPVEPPAVRVELAEQGVGPFDVEAAASASGEAGEWQTVLPTPVAGTYTVSVGVRLDTFTQRTLRFEVVVR